MKFIFTLNEEEGFVVVPPGIKRSQAITHVPEGAVITEEIYELPEDDDRGVSPSPEQVYRALELALDRHIDSVARAKGYDNRITATMRAGFQGPWQQEGIAFAQWMDSCYALCHQIQAEVLAGTRPIPSSEELLSEMPAMTWPV